MRDVGILGGGVSGLFTAYFLGGDVEVLEADSTPGGLARCFGTDGFRSDIGGHILFSKDKEALAHEVAVLGDNVHQGVRANKILYEGLHVKYPFENGIDVLPKEQIVDILHTFIENPHKAKPTNFLEWLYHTFGDGLTNRYMLPYNQKIWKTPLEEMSLEWVDRVPRPPLIDLLKTGVGIQTEGYTHQLYFQYPKVGGFESMPNAVAAKLGPKVTTGFRVKALRPCDGGWAVTSTEGEERRYRQIVATIPIGTLFSALGEVPAPVRAAADGLRYNSLRVALIGVKGTDLPAYTALYVPEPKSLYHRVCYNRVFSPDLVPDGHSSVSCEITVSPGSDLDSWSDDRLLDRVVDDLVRDGVLARDKICYRAVHREVYAYVIYTTGYNGRVATIRDYTQSRGIHLAGRFAEFQYVNTDACVRRALDLAKELRGSGDIAPEARLTASAGS
ncbi:MAG TPA: FAD-dependent oxidoreductase [Polyangiaceae bacterium]|nr:FAD-dependent oxidoreductase [Polyangiaceae bacterium]